MEIELKLEKKTITKNAGDILKKRNSNTDIVFFFIKHSDCKRVIKQYIVIKTSFQLFFGKKNMRQ